MVDHPVEDEVLVEEVHLEEEGGEERDRADP